MDSGNGLEMIPENSIIAMEEIAGNIKSIYALYIASSRAGDGVPVTYLTLQSDEYLRKIMKSLKIPASDRITVSTLRPENAGDEIHAMIRNPGTPLVVIDPFSIFMASEDFTALRTMLFELLAASRNGTTFLLLMDTGVLPERQEHLVRAMADGVIRFVTVPEGDRLRNYISIPKMLGSFPQEKMLPFTINSDGFLIDTRERHG